MKKVLLLCLILVSLLVLGCASAYAEGIVSSGLPTDFIDWDSLRDFSVMVGAVVVIVQLCKLSIDKVWKIPTQVIVYIISAVLALLTQAFAPTSGGLTWSTVVLALINAFFVAITAMYIYEHTIANVELKKLVQDTVDMEDFANPEDVASNLTENAGK